MLDKCLCVCLCVCLSARLVVSGQMFTGLPMNHSWIGAIVLLAAGVVKEATQPQNTEIPGGWTVL